MAETLYTQCRKDRRSKFSGCLARLYLEGKANPVTPQPVPPTPFQQGAELSSKRWRTAAECVQELKDLKTLLESGALDVEEFTEFKARLLRGD